MRVLLIDPHHASRDPRPDAFTPHIGLLRIAAVVESRGHEVRYLSVKLLRDAGLFSRGAEFGGILAELVAGERADLVGVTSRCDTFPDVCAFLEAWARRGKTTPIVVGGPHATAHDLDLLEVYPAVSYVVLGEGERTFGELLDALCAGRDPSSIGGLALRVNGAPTRTARREPIANLDELPLPAYRIVDDELRHSGYHFASIDLGRGCPHGCSFCATGRFWSPRPRMRSAANFIREAEMLRDRYGTRGFYLEHDGLMAERARFLEFCRELEQTAPWIRWAGSARVECLDEETAAAAADAGCWSLYFGAESGDDETLAELGKRRSAGALHGALDRCFSAGIAAVGSFIIGLPGESADSIRATLRLAADCARHPAVSLVQIHPFFPSSGSPLVAESMCAVEFDGASPEIAVSPFRDRPDVARQVLEYPNIFPDYGSCACAVPRETILRLAMHYDELLRARPHSTALILADADPLELPRSTRDQSIADTLLLEDRVAALPFPGKSAPPGVIRGDSILRISEAAAIVESPAAAARRMLLFRRFGAAPIIRELEAWEAQILASAEQSISIDHILLERAPLVGVEKKSVLRRIRFFLNEGILIHIKIAN